MKSMTYETQIHSIHSIHSSFDFYSNIYFLIFFKIIKISETRVDTMDPKYNSLNNQRVIVPPYEFVWWQISRMQCSIFQYFIM